MKKILQFSFIAALLIKASICVAQDINAFAGTGASGFSGDGGPATLAQFSSLSSIAKDNSGNMYVTDYWNSRIRKINTAGIISTFAGNGVPGFSGDGGQAASAQLNFPSGIAVDQSGNVYICDNCRIRKVNTSGIITTIAGTGTCGFSGDGGQAINAQISPGAIFVDVAANIYFGDGSTYRIRKINSSGVISTLAGNGTFGYSGDGGPAINAQLYSPGAMAMDAAGSLYFVDAMNHTLRKINTSGIISTIAGVGGSGYNGDNISATIAQLSGPSGVALDAFGNIYIADRSNHRIRKVNSSGIISTFAGTGVAGWSGDGGPAITAQLTLPSDVELGNSGSLYVADAGNYRIRKITPTVPTPSICLVTVDSLGNNNEIYWEKTLYPQTDTFIVLRETNAPNVYTSIARISKSAFSSYVDTNRSIGPFNGNPNFSFYKYKLQIKDTLGNLSSQSPYHQSIYIQDAQTGNFSWNYYFIEGIGNIQTASYTLWRQDQLSGLTSTVGATSANVANDPLYSSLAQTGNVKWYVSTTGFNCNPSQKTVAGKTRTKSNNTNEKQFPTAIKMELFSPDFIRIFPNPAVNKVTLQLSSKVQDMEYKLVDVTGRVIIVSKLNGEATVVNLEELPKGIYFINIFQKRSFIITKKIILVD